MPSQEAAPDLNIWADAIKKLSAYQSFAFVGFCFLRPNPPLSILDTTQFTEEPSLAAFERWARRNFRKALYFYCDLDDRAAYADAAGDSLKDSVNDTLKAAASQMFNVAGILLLPGLAFLIAVSKMRSEDWCKKYGMRPYDGRGVYTGDAPVGDIEGHFNLDFKPPITELVEDESVRPLRGRKIVIKEKAESRGRMMTPGHEEVMKIVLNFREGSRHRFEFQDMTTGKTIKGSASGVFPVREEKENILGFITEDAA